MAKAGLGGGAQEIRVSEKEARVRRERSLASNREPGGARKRQATAQEDNETLRQTLWCRISMSRGERSMSG